MDDNEAEHLRLTYTGIGVIMEDASVVALSLGGPQSRPDPQVRERLVKSVANIMTLTSAAEAIQQ